MFNINNINPNSTAVITENGSYSYSELQKISDDIVINIQERTLIFCLCENSLPALAGYVGFFNNKQVQVLLSSTIDKELLGNLICTYKPEYLWIPSFKRNDIEKVYRTVFEYQNYALVKNERAGNTLLNKNLSVLLTTSGSTGSPKLVKLSYSNILSNAESIKQYLGIDKYERPITSLPIHYSFGLSIINSHFLAGSTILLTDRSIMEKEFWSFLKEQKATSLSGVPYTFEMLKKLRFFRMDLPYLKTLTQAGGKLNDELNKEFSEFCLEKGKKFYVMYGQTEATARMSYLPPEFSLKKLGSMGIAIPGGEFSLIDTEGNTIQENNVVGELVYNGPNVSMGYAECIEDLAKGDDNKGVLVTGDMAKRDDDGFYYIVGRKKRFIKIFGNRVNLDETERLLKSVIADCACTGQDDLMEIFITENHRLEEVRNFISSKTGIHRTAFDVKVIEDIPKNGSGKTIYSALKN